MGRIEADIAVEGWLFEIRPCSRIDLLSYKLTVFPPFGMRLIFAHMHMAQ